MRTLFFKLFFWFWLALTLCGLFFFILAMTIRTGPLHAEFAQRMAEEHQRLAFQELRSFGHSAAISHEHGSMAERPPGADNFGPFIREMSLFTATGRRLTGSAAPLITAAARQLLLDSASELLLNKERTVAAVRITSPKGTSYVAAGFVMEPPPAPPPPHGRLLLPPDFWPRFLISLIIGSLVCYGLAWHLTGPIRRLRQATQKLTGGDLTARVAVSRSGKGDEVTDLSRDFNRMAEQIEHLLASRKQLTRDISHELRSPLARLQVALGLARRTATPDTALALDRIEREAEQLNTLIGELLALSLLESTAAFQQEVVDLAALMEEVVHDADFEAAGGNRRVELVGSTALIVSGNRELLRRALENVIRNAIRHTAPQTTVTVTLARQDAELAVLRIRDHGPGVPEEALTEIFRPFYRIEEARDRQSGGSGIGLAITEQTVRRHNGSVTARNHETGGLEVSICLPTQEA